MTPDQIKQLNASFDQVEAIADDAAALFYERLFEVAPGVRPLFKGDMQKQGRMLMSAIGMVVRGLDDPDAILPEVQALGRRHHRYGAEAAHYPVVGDCLLWTLEQGLGDAFTPDLKSAWAEAYGILSELMIQAHNEAATQTTS